MKIGFVGLGQMGSGIAANLVKSGREVTVYNRTAAKAAPLVALGAKVAQTAGDAAKGDVVITMLADDHAVEAAVFGAGGILAALPKGALHISSSTISVALSDRLTEAHAKAGQRFVAAPVFGRPDAAAAARLFVAVAGLKDAIATAQPLLDTIGQKTFVIGEKPSLANLVKLSGNFLIATVIEALGEAVALVAKGGVDRHAYIDFLTSTLFNAPVYKIYGTIIAEQKFSPAGFAAPLGAKDVRLALAAAEDLRVPLPLGSLLRDRFLRLMAEGGEQLDWSAISTLAARDSGQS
ncbi:MAG TPA: NAD(P)-dependent oxidoreductase [Rhizomicrobium sp.]|nr:NAD(P)-dependent oxidoreductase [Rhizomicrobium sp.]